MRFRRTHPCAPGAFLSPAYLRGHLAPIESGGSHDPSAPGKLMRKILANLNENVIGLRWVSWDGCARLAWGDVELVSSG